MKNTQSPSTKPGPWRRRFTPALVALSLVIGAMALTAKPAEAAGIVTGCFSPVGSLTASRLPVRLYALTESGIIDVGVGTTTDMNGCVTLWVPAAYQRYYVVMWIEYSTYGRHYWGGATSFAYPGNGWAWMSETVACEGHLCYYY